MSEPTNPYISRDPDDVDAGYSPTSERLTAIWIEQTAIARTQIENGNTGAVLNLIMEIDENLSAFDEGGAAPGSDEAYGIYTDAVVRSALPYGQPPIALDEVARQLHNVGVDVPTFSPADAAQRTGIRALTSEELERSIHAMIEETTGTRDVEPAGMTDVAAARLSVRRTLASINDDGQAAQGHLAAANTALGSAIATLRPDTSADVTRAHESVQQAAENVDALTKTAADISKTDAPDLEQAARNADAEVTIYSTPDCPGCFATKRALDKAGVQYDDIDLSKNPTLAAKFRQQGIKQAPIVETKDGDRWTGHNPGKLKEHGLDYRTRQNRAAGTDTGRGVER